MVNIVPLLIGVGIGLLGVFMLLTGVSRLRSWNTLRSSTAGAVTGTGMAEIEGEAKPLHETLDPPRHDTDALVYDYSKEEYRPDHDHDDGSDWHTVETDNGRVPFVLDTGDREVVVDPDGADVLLDEAVDNTGNGIRHRSSRLDVGEPCYTAGTVVRAGDASVDTDGHQYAVEGSDEGFSGGLAGLTGSPFVLSDSGEDAAESKLMKGGLGALAGGVLVTGLGAVFLLVGVGG